MPEKPIVQTIHLSQIEWKKRNIPTTFNLEIDRNFLLDSDYGTINKHITKQLNALFDDKCVNFVAETIL
jgi:hypothetical protein